MSPSLAATANDPSILSVHVGGDTASLAVDKAAPSRAKVARDSATYPDIAPDTDLDYQVTPGTVKETVLLKKPPAPGRSECSGGSSAGAAPPSSGSSCIGGGEYPLGGCDAMNIQAHEPQPWLHNHAVRGCLVCGVMVSSPQHVRDGWERCLDSLAAVPRGCGLDILELVLANWECDQ